MSLYVLFHEDFCTSANNCDFTLFQRLQIDKFGHSNHLFVQIQQQNIRKNSELCPKLELKE